MSPADSGSPYRSPPSLGAGQKLTLHLGVVDQLYRSYVTNAKGRRVKGSAIPTTTGDVAEILEAKYGLFSAFARVAEKDIAHAIEEGLSGAIESLVMGHAVDPWGAGTQAINQRFRDFISSGESERSGIAGTPTKAALVGVSHRYAHPYAKHPRRPSFRDTGLLMSSFTSWVSG